MKPPKKLLGPTWQLRLTSFLGEILTIVVGIVLGLAVENLKEDADRQERATELLVGMYQDLERDVKEMQGDSAALHMKAQAYENFYKMGLGQRVDPEVVAGNLWTLYSTTALIPNTSCFEVMKAHGELDIWQNSLLLTEIFSLYQEAIPNLLNQTQACNRLVTQDLTPYLRQHMELDTAGNIINLQSCLKSHYVRLLLMNLADLTLSAEYQYGVTMGRYRHLMALIETEVGRARLLKK